MLNAMTKMEFLERTANLVCQPTRVKLVKPPQSCNAKRLSSSKPYKETMKKLDHYISNDPTAKPVGIVYCGNVLLQGKKFVGTKKNLFGKQTSTEECNDHVSLVIGRREIKGECQYLVRNSWGTDPSGYSTDWDVEHGNIWVDADALIKNTIGLETIK
jgi:hypothetical protein